MMFLAMTVSVLTMMILAVGAFIGVKTYVWWKDGEAKFAKLANEARRCEGCVNYKSVQHDPDETVYY